MNTKFSISLAILLLLCCTAIKANPKQNSLPKLIVTTDINIDKGDPDDRQSLVHLLLYANELDIRGIVVDRVAAQGAEATEMVIKCYEEDYNNKAYRFQKLGYPHPDAIRAKVFTSYEEAISQLAPEMETDNKNPYYVAAWGSMGFVKRLLDLKPELSAKLRVLTIGTVLRFPVEKEEFGLRNWNDMNGDRMAIFSNPQFNDMWWIENDWAYNGMFSGESPREFLEELTTYGALGQHAKDCVWNQKWARYFRVGDTPTIMYLIDNENLDDPLSYNLGGCFTKPFPKTRPNYYIDYAPNLDWDYVNPLENYDKAMDAYQLRIKEMEQRRDAMYLNFKAKLDILYCKGRSEK